MLTTCGDEESRLVSEIPRKHLLEYLAIDRNRNAEERFWEVVDEGSNKILTGEE